MSIIAVDILENSAQSSPLYQLSNVPKIPEERWKKFPKTIFFKSYLIFRMGEENFSFGDKSKIDLFCQGFAKRKSLH